MSSCGNCGEQLPDKKNKQTNKKTKQKNKKTKQKNKKTKQNKLCRHTVDSLLADIRLSVLSTPVSPQSVIFWLSVGLGSCG